MSTIFDKLHFRGVEIGEVQSVDEMTIVPIVGSNRGEVAQPSSLKFRQTTSYGTMVFENQDRDRDAIVPSNMMVRGRGAQDHAMSGSGVVAKARSKSFDNACCIEESQGGYLSSAGNDEDILPIALRKEFLDRTFRSRNSYSKLWPKIKTWLNGLRLSSGRNAAHLRYFYDTPDIKAALEDFAAEFEPVENQIGAIIMFSGVPVGIEIMPSSDHWEAYWKMLIRGCYGAELLRLKMLNKIKPTTLVLPDIPKDATADKVKEIMEAFTTHLRQEILPLMESIEIKGQTSIESNGSLQTSLITTSSGGGGDLIQQGSEPIYLSLVL